MNPETTVLDKQPLAPPIDKIAVWPAQILRKKAEVVSEINSSTVQLIIDMFVTLKQLGGIGLAAPQMKENKAILVYRVGDEQGCMINPVISDQSEKTEIGQEGCLSFPGLFINVPRAMEIDVEFTDLEGERKVEKYQGRMARVIQHEVDHLEGRVIINHLSKLKRDRIMKKVSQAHKQLKSIHVKEKSHDSDRKQRREEEKKTRRTKEKAKRKQARKSRRKR